MPLPRCRNKCSVYCKCSPSYLERRFLLVQICYSYVDILPSTFPPGSFFILLPCASFCFPSIFTRHSQPQSSGLYRKESATKIGHDGGDYSASSSSKPASPRSFDFSPCMPFTMASYQSKDTIDCSDGHCIVPIHSSGFGNSL